MEMSRYYLVIAETSRIMAFTEQTSDANLLRQSMGTVHINAIAWLIHLQ